MTEQTQDKSKVHKRGRKFALSIIALSLLIAVVAFVYSRINSPTVDERLAVFEAARAIPDSENAAILYEQLLGDPRMNSFDYDPHSLKDGSNELDFFQPSVRLEHLLSS